VPLRFDPLERLWRGV